MTRFKDHVTEAAGQVAHATKEAFGGKIATGMTVGGGTTAFIGGLTPNVFAIVFGMVLGLIGMVLQVFQTLDKRALNCAEKRLIQKRAKREEEEHAAKMAMYR